jgi:epoxide hydrolase-like predicted phosphatase
MQTVVFDFGNVVGFFDHHRTLRRLERFTTMPAQAMYASVYAGQLEEDFESGRLTEEQFLAHFIDRCQLSCTADVLGEACADIFWPNPEVCELIPRLKGRCRLLLGSNTNAIHARFFRKQFGDVLGHFDELVLSHEIGVRKPKPGFFEHCQRLAGSSPEQCLFIDDLPENVQAAKNLGWRGIVYKPDNGLAAALKQHGVIGH